jgi:Toprim domain
MRMDRFPNFPGNDDAFERAKSRSLSQFLEHELGGCIVKGRGRFTRFSSCPNPDCAAHESRHSERLVVIDDVRFRCFRCGQFGSIIDAAMLLWGIDSPLAAARAVLGEAWTGERRRLQADPQLVAQRQERELARQEALHCLCTVVDLSRDEGPNLAYLCEERAIPQPIVREAQARRLVGFLPASRTRAATLLIERLGAPLLERAGFWDRARYPTPWISARPLVFFFPGLSAAEFRLNRDPRPGEKKSLLCGSTRYPWYWKGEDATRVLVAEGMIDLLSAVALDYPGHVIGVPGCNNWQPFWFAKLKENGVRHVDIAFDNDVHAQDNPGQRWATKLGEFLDELDLSWCNAAPENGDLNDLLKKRRCGAAVP